MSFGLGFVLGTFAGFALAALCHAAARGDRLYDEALRDREDVDRED